MQTFDADAVASIRDNPRHIEMDAEMYADPQAKGNVANELDVMILSATEVDTNFNVNVLTASDGVIMGAWVGTQIRRQAPTWPWWWLPSFANGCPSWWIGW